MNPPTPGTYLTTWQKSIGGGQTKEQPFPTYWNGEAWERPAELNRHWVVVGWKKREE